jgi:hypothetical protein
MPERVPSPEPVQEICVLTCFYFDWVRRATEWRSASAGREKVRALARLREYYRSTDAAAPHGWGVPLLPSLLYVRLV